MFFLRHILTAVSKAVWPISVIRSVQEHCAPYLPSTLL